jgi:hypothetical protein
VSEVDGGIVEGRAAAEVWEDEQTTSMDSRDRGVIGDEKEAGQEMHEEEGGEGASLAGMIQALASLKQHSARYGDISEQMLRQALGQHSARYGDISEQMLRHAVGQHGQTEAATAIVRGGGGGNASCAEAPTRWLDAVEAFDPSEF